MNVTFIIDTFIQRVVAVACSSDIKSRVVEQSDLQQPMNVSQCSNWWVRKIAHSKIYIIFTKQQ